MFGVIYIHRLNNITNNASDNAISLIKIRGENW